MLRRTKYSQNGQLSRIPQRKGLVSGLVCHFLLNLSAVTEILEQSLAIHYSTAFEERERLAGLLLDLGMMETNAKDEALDIRNPHQSGE